MSFEDDPELRAIFVQEAETRLDRVTSRALELEARPRDHELVSQLFRDVHTLKGSAPLVGLHGVADVAHRLEDLLGDLRAGRREVAPGDADAILGVADALRAMIAKQLAGQDAAAEIEAAAAALALAGRPSRAPEPVPARPAGPDAPAEPEPLTATPPAADSTPPADASPAAADESIAVSLARLDRLIRLAGEAITSRLRLGELLGSEIESDPDAHEAALGLARALDAIQDEALGTRMTTLATLAAPLRRAVRDVARGAGKDVVFSLEGERVEVDKAVLDALREPLLHLVRNAVDHGLETPAEREAAGKPRTGKVTVEARRHGGEVRIAVSDDGDGLDLDALRAKAGAPELDDEQAAHLIFRAGLSTAGAITGVSGRGVGMDVVRASLERMRGRVDVQTKAGAGTTFALTAPLTLAVVPCVLLEAGGERYALPAHAAVTVVEDADDAEAGLEGGAAIWVGPDIVPLSDLGAVVGLPSAGTGPAIVVRAGTEGERCALRVDSVAGQRDVTVKELGSILPRNELIAGASIEPDGSVVLVLDPATLVARAGDRRRAPVAPAREDSHTGDGAPAMAASILVVDDAVTVRELQRGMLQRAGYAVRTAADGQDALNRLAEERPDLVVTDVEMPELDGFALTEAIRADPALSSTPVLIVTSRDADEDRSRGLEAGADAYLVKQDFDEASLLEAVARLLGGPS